MIVHARTIALGGRFELMTEFGSECLNYEIHSHVTEVKKNLLINPNPRQNQKLLNYTQS